MTIRLLIILLLTISLTECKPKTEDEVLLILPYGKYSNWTNYNIKYLTFKQDEDRLVVDTTYGPETNHFTVHSSENLDDYPVITQFLKGTLTEFRDIKKELDMTNCDPRLSVYIKYMDAQDSTLIQLKTTLPCGTIEHQTMKGLGTELKALKEKYAR